jgi:3-(3-hydroxy-phenyl)propionate hydroxylase
MKYKPKPRFEDGFLLRDGVSARHNTPVGRLLPQPRVSIEGRDDILLDELFGDDFILLALTDDLERFKRETAQYAFSRLGVRRIALTGRVTTSKCGIVAAHDASGALAAFAHGKREQILLIRPDRYVAGSFVLSETTAFAERLDGLLQKMAAPTALNSSISAPRARLAG